MLNKSLQGYLLLADISGFVAFLSGVELDHAQEILQELQELITRCLEPVLTVSQRYSDALLAYVPAERLTRGETLLEAIEVTYAAFRDRLEGIRRHTSCTCNACRAVPDLELNFLVHYGEYVLNRVAGHEGLLGLDVDLVRRRLIKDQVASAGREGGYALFTQTCLEHLGIAGDGMQTQTGNYPSLGELRTYLLNLHAKYQEEAARRMVVVLPEAANASVARDFTVAPTTLWDWLNDPQMRSRWMKGRHWSAGLRPNGRTGAGARNHCAHGVGTVMETILDWKPFDYFTVEVVPSSGPLAMLQTYKLEPLADGQGTRLRIFLRLKGTLPDWLARLLCNAGASLILKSDLERLARLTTIESASGPNSLK